MTKQLQSSLGLTPNPDWPSLPLFDRSKWQRVRFGDVVKQMKEQVNPEEDGIERYVAGEHMETENVHIRKWGSVGDGYLGPAFIRGFRKGQVLYGSRRTYLKKVAVAEWDGVTANTTFVLETVEGKMLQELLPWLMLSERFTKHSVQESKGSTNPYINFPDIAKFEFNLPPLDQQRRFAEILWAVDEALQKANELQTSVEAVRSGIVEEHFNRSLENKINIQPLEAVAKVSYGITLGSFRKALPIERPYLRVANLQRNAFDLSEIKTINCDENEVSRFELVEGDVLIVEGHATVTEIGRAAVWRLGGLGMLHQNHLIRARCSDALIPEYLNLCINAGAGQDYFRSRAKSSSGLNTINSTVVKHFPVPKMPVRDQEKLVAETDQFDGTLRAVASNQALLRNLVAQLLNTIAS